MRRSPETRTVLFARPPDPPSARWCTSRIPEGKGITNWLHFDVRVGTGLVGPEAPGLLEAECVRLEALGAVRGQLLLAGGENESCQNMQDVEGDEFYLD
ncbi:hypothetical protein GCM10009662_31510 [Catellatospora coxensis]|uniref:Uncharacterized protein n=1 Tax=Catellatospora coxensis TaxID=310354 RepID=A0A8J3KXW6_9ACTN|nr:hypothetical protein Cco03nite_17760 [Catellatospora coxensis]